MYGSTCQWFSEEIGCKAIKATTMMQSNILPKNTVYFNDNCEDLISFLVGHLNYHQSFKGEHRRGIMPQTNLQKRRRIQGLPTLKGLSYGCAKV